MRGGSGGADADPEAKGSGLVVGAGTVVAGVGCWASVFFSRSWRLRSSIIVCCLKLLTCWLSNTLYAVTDVTAIVPRAAIVEIMD